MKIAREQVLAYRVAAQQLDRSAKTVRGLRVLDIGVQDGAGEQARLALDARLARTPAVDAFGPAKSLALVWSLRGAPHVHRRGDLDALTGALYPLSEADAAQRINETGPSVQRAGLAALEQYELAVTAMRAAVRKPTAKGTVSTEVTKAIPQSMRRACRACRTRHISDSAMRASFLAAGLELEPGTAPPVLLPRTGSKHVGRPDLDALAALCRGYLCLLGPATQAHVAGYLAARRADVEQAWPDDLVEVSVDGAKRWLPADRVRDLERAPDPDVVRLLGGFDPILQARDRDLIVPDKAVQKALWPVLGRPGAVYVDGEVAGTWRPKSAGTKLAVLITEFAPLPKPVREEVEEEAGRVAAVRGLELRSVSWAA
jgi:hypothetical protein